MVSRLILAFAFIGLLGSCSTTLLEHDDALRELRPVRALEPEKEKLPANLYVEVSNVADMGSSNKHRFQLYINGQSIKPKNEIHNATRIYYYELTLVPGYYEITGEYFWHNGWDEEKTSVKNADLVKIEKDKQTVLRVNISKDERGRASVDEMMFDISYKKIPDYKL
jgi:hypothetical protein